MIWVFWLICSFLNLWLAAKEEIKESGEVKVEIDDLFPIVAIFLMGPIGTFLFGCFWISENKKKVIFHYTPEEEERDPTEPPDIDMRV